MPRDVKDPWREIERLRALLAEIETEAKRCNQAHKDVSPSFLLQRITDPVLHVEEKED